MQKLFIYRWYVMVAELFLEAQIPTWVFKETDGNDMPVVL